VEAPLRTVVRFVDPEMRPGAASTPPELQLSRPGIHAWEAVDPERPTATIAGETRTVLAAIASGPRRFERGVTIDVGGRLSLALPSTDFTRNAPFVTVVRVRDASTPTAASRALPGRLVDAGTERIEVVLPEPWRAPKLDVYAETFRAPSGDSTRYDTAPFRVPQQAELELAFGVLEAAAAEGDVAFGVAACTEEACSPLLDESIDPAKEGGAGWQDRRFAMAELAGETIRLRFETRRVSAGEGGFALPVFSDPRVVAPTPVELDLPSIILLSIDTLRADHLELHGYPRATAPFTSGRLADGGVVFDAFVSAATTTGPSHMTMFTSLAPSVHGVAGGHRAMATAVPTLASLLRDAGYETAAVTDDGALDHERGFGLGFDRFFENKSARAMETGQIEITFERALRWLDTRGERPSFLFLHSFQVHDPYTPPARYAKLFAADAMAPAADQPPVVRAARALMADYDREIRYVDDELAAFVEALDARGFFERGLLVVTSDHGEAFFEHGRQGHGGKPHEELLHAPLLFYGRGVAAGRRVGDVQHHADLMPTLLELAGLDAPPHSIGRSFASHLLTSGGRIARPDGEAPRVSEAWGRFVGARSPALAARLGRYKMLKTQTESGAEYELFDLEHDRRERQNLIDAPEAPATPGLDGARRTLREALDAYGDQAAATRRNLGAGQPGNAAAPRPIDPDREAKLRALGYIE